jgi:hypothetical protein
VYSAELGRFPQTDPIQFDAGDGNLYRYVKNSAADMLDPLGLQGGRHCCGGKPYNPTIKCCQNSKIVDKVPFWKNHYECLNACIEAHVWWTTTMAGRVIITLPASAALLASGGASGAGVGVGVGTVAVGTTVTGAIGGVFGEALAKSIAYEKCQFTVCPKKS